MEVVTAREAGDKLFLVFPEAAVQVAGDSYVEHVGCVGENVDGVGFHRMV